MTATAISAFESTLQTTYEWLGEVGSEIGRDDSQHAYRALRAVLLALRDRMTVEEATDLGAQLPMLVRGFYYEGWNPSRNPSRDRNKAEFLAHVNQNLVEGKDGDPEEVTRAVLRVLAARVTTGEVAHVKANLPSDVQHLWPA